MPIMVLCAVFYAPVAVFTNRPNTKKRLLVFLPAACQPATLTTA